MEDLATLFQRAKGEAVQVGGRLVHAIFRRRFSAPALVRLRRVHESTNPVPGIRLKVHDGAARLDGEKHSDLVFWSDTAPPELELEVRPKKGKTAELRIWNCWRDGKIMQAWLLNAGMLIETESDTTTMLRCNSGPNSSLSFDDLILEVELVPEASS